MSYFEIFLEGMANSIKSFGSSLLSPEISSTVLSSVGSSVIETGSNVMDKNDAALGSITTSLGSSITTNAMTAYTENKKLAIVATQEYVKSLSETELLEMKELLLAKKAILELESDQTLSRKL